MFWLLALGAFALLACAGGSDSSRPRAGDSVMEFLTPAERAELEARKRDALRAREDAGHCRVAHAAARDALERARRRVKTCWRFLVCSVGPACVALGVMLGRVAGEPDLRIWIGLTAAMALGLVAMCAFVIRRRREQLWCAERGEASSRHQSLAAEKKQKDLAEVCKRAEVHALRLANQRRQTRAQRLEEEERGVTIAAWVEEQQAEAAREAEDERRRFVGFVKEAFNHWRHVAPDVKAFIAIHGNELVAQRDLVQAAYTSGEVLGATADECFALAERALRELPHEVRYWFPRAKERTAANLARVLRAYSGAFREVLLPMALEQQRLGREPPRLEGKAPRQKRSELERLLAAMPEEAAARAHRSTSEALTVSSLGNFQQRVLDARRAELRRSGHSEDAIEKGVDALRQNLERSASEFAEERGLISDALE